MNCLYIFEDGTIYQSTTAPTKNDFKSIGDGLVDVVTHNGKEFLQFNEDGDTHLCSFTGEQDGYTVPG